MGERSVAERYWSLSTHIHLNILLYDVFKCVFWHLFYGSEGCIKIKTIGKAETAFGYILIADDASKRV